jgi:hypothetical protein
VSKGAYWCNVHHDDVDETGLWVEESEADEDEEADVNRYTIKYDKVRQAT